MGQLSAQHGEPVDDAKVNHKLLVKPRDVLVATAQNKFDLSLRLQHLHDVI
jgi:hypothetical protein